MIPSYIFWPIAFIILACAIGVVRSKNIVHSALLLILTFIGVAVVFILLEADFLALAQVLIYAGAISILIVFAIMLTRRNDMKNSNPFNKYRIVSIMLCSGFFALIARLILVSNFNYKSMEIKNTISSIADEFFINHMIAFEGSAILLLIAMVGAIVLAKGVKN
ncbi:NADH-quinone oxidoreductase subunit J [Clostridium sp. 19966]|uniref:NADH-quinone oxidoreductase subunit J family protein n=1 Tax=Clostridium sp. 19966 TaxID=2768166 RepID=UPI0028E0841B|nr:NADH-quinone oxidoreductase subunit J [Clostridium sp. 19966]MDT8718633.1 NADH-quinone oxidoreductase subunit J [Clostridium sp. 19966]